MLCDNHQYVHTNTCFFFSFSRFVTRNEIPNTTNPFTGERQRHKMHGRVSKNDSHELSAVGTLKTTPEEVFKIWNETGVFFANITRFTKNIYPPSSDAYELCNLANKFYFTEIVNAAKAEEKRKEKLTDKYIDKKLKKMMANVDFHGKVSGMARFQFGSKVIPSFAENLVAFQLEIPFKYQDDLALGFDSGNESATYLRGFSYLL